MNNKNIHTACKDCCFAVYDDITQTACSRDMLEKYKNITEVIEAYDEEREFYVIKNRLCAYKRNEQWMLKNKENIESQLDIENQINVHVIVFSDGVFENVKTTIDSINNQEKRPNHVTLVQLFGESQKEVSLFTNYLKTCNFKWRVQNMLEEASIDYIVHSLLGFIPSTYYVVMHAKETINNKFLKNLNNVIINDLQQFAAISNNGSTPYVIPYLVHKYWASHGDPELSILQNILNYDSLCSNKITLPITVLQ